MVGKLKGIKVKVFPINLPITRSRAEPTAENSEHQSLTPSDRVTYSECTQPEATSRLSTSSGVSDKLNLKDSTIPLLKSVTAMATEPRIAHIIYHTHWDREWYLPVTDFVKGLTRVVDRALNNIENIEDAKFLLDGQVVALEDYLSVKPTQIDKVRNAVNSGKLFCGPWYVLSDEFLADAGASGGEALVRNLLIADKILNQYGIKGMKVGYLPDTFGHVSQMPQVLKGFDIDNAVLWRGVGISPDKLKSEMNWIGSDGTEILMIYLPYGYGNAELVHLSKPVKAMRYEYVQSQGGKHKLVLPSHADEPKFLPAEKVADNITNLMNLMKPFQRTRHYLLLAGGDHALPSNMPKSLSDKVNAILRTRGIQLKESSLPEFIEKVKSEIKGIRLTDVRGELRSMRYAPLLPGVLSTRIHIKQRNARILTDLLHYGERLSLLASLYGKPYPAKLLEDCWKTILKNHPHDDITGCSVDEVYELVDKRFDKVEHTVSNLQRSTLKYLTSLIDTSQVPQGAKPIVVFNTLIRDRKANIVLDPEDIGIPLDELIVKDLKGNVIPWQRTHDGKIALIVDDVPSMGYKLIYATRGKTHQVNTGANDSIGKSDRLLDSGTVKVEVAEDGSLTITDKSTGKSLDGLLWFEDSGDAGDEYNYSPPLHDEVITTRGKKANIELIENGPVRAVVKIEHELEVPSKISDDRLSRVGDKRKLKLVTYLTLWKSSNRIECETHLNNVARDHRLRVNFSPKIETNVSYADTPFDVVSRSITPEEPISKAEAQKYWKKLYDGFASEKPIATYPMDSFVDINDGRIGLAVFTEGLPEYEAVREGDRTKLSVTLLRSVGWLSLKYPEFLYRPNYHAGPKMETPGAQELGYHVFKYAISVHAGNWDEAKLPTEARDYLVPALYSVTTRHRGELPASMSLLSSSNPQVVVSALKPSEDGKATIVRLYNPTSKAQRTMVRFDSKLGTKIYSANLKEEPQALLDTGTIQDGEMLGAELELAPKKIVTLRIESRGETDSLQRAG